MANLLNLVKGFLALIFLLALGLGVLVGTWLILVRVSSELAATTLTTLAGVSLAIYQFTSSRNAEREKQIQQEHRIAKAAEYEEFVDRLFQTINPEKVGVKKLSEKELANWMFRFMKKVLVWGSDDVVKAFGTFMNSNALAEANNVSPELQPYKTLALMEELLLAIRKDLGHANRTLKPGDISRIYINDFDVKVLPAKTEQLPSKPK